MKIKAICAKTAKLHKIIKKNLRTYNLGFSGLVGLL